MEIQFTELDHIHEDIHVLLKSIEVVRSMTIPEWVDLKTACEYKGIKYSTVINRKKLQPDESKGAKVSGRMMWPRDVIVDWIIKTDDDLGYEPEPKHPKLNVAD